MAQSLQFPTFNSKFLFKFKILFQILQTKMMIFGNTTNITCRFNFKQYNLFYTVQKHEICPFMENVPHVDSSFAFH